MLQTESYCRGIHQTGSGPPSNTIKLVVSQPSRKSILRSLATACAGKQRYEDLYCPIRCWCNEWLLLNNIRRPETISSGFLDQAAQSQDVLVTTTMIERIFDDGNLGRCRHGIIDTICNFEIESFYSIIRLLHCNK